jgi:hypothetical protein
MGKFANTPTEKAVSLSDDFLSRFLAYSSLTNSLITQTIWHRKSNCFENLKNHLATETVL